MIGAFWNVRGLNKEGRLQCITDFVNNNKLDFVGFHETKKVDFEDTYLSHIHKDFSWKNRASCWNSWRYFSGC